MEKENTIGMDAFDIKSGSDAGTKIDLYLPDGTKTDHWLNVLGADSSKFQRARARANREEMELMKTKGKNNKQQDAGTLFEKQMGIRRKLVAALVSDWSFPEKCNIETVSAFFEKAPQVQTQVDNFAGERSNFFAKPPKS